MNVSIIPLMGSNEAKKKHNGSNEWKLFARNITKNPFVKNMVIKRASNECSWCNRPTRGEFMLHHLDYDHTCQYGIEKRIPRPTEKRPNKQVTIPDCESCYQERLDFFNECLKRLTPVHGKCNAEIEALRGENIDQLSFDF